MSAPTSPAGWYPDPDNSTTGQRYWDGTAWTEHRAPGSAAPQPAPASTATAHPTPSGTATATQANPFRRAIALLLTGVKRLLGLIGAWFRRLNVWGWLAFSVLAFLTLVLLPTVGAGGGLIWVGIIALVTGIYAFATKRPSWAAIAGRKAAAGVIAGGLIVTVLGGTAAAGASEPTTEARPSTAASAEPSPEPSRTPKPTPTPTGEPDAPETVAGYDGTAAVGVADSTATQGTALALLDTLPIKGRAPKTGYDREAGYGTAWLDVDSNGCDTRNDILARDLEPETKSGPCKVLTGTLTDPYTGKTIDFVRGNTTSLAVQIDHVVALMNSWETGAQQLTQAQRISLANDPINLFAVDGPTNSQKGAGDAATWLPPKKDFRCTYVARQVSVKATYGLWVTQAEHDAIANILTGCPDEPAVTSAFTPVAAPVVEPAPTPAPAPAPAPAPEPAPAPAPVDVYYENCDAVRAAGASPIRAGDPGYSRKLDRDGDGVGCE
ncbi:GmrSD restriction endonuclease domain-containing protein [Agromyces agglutinans]|uniref:GmrSD restriction endonuclease domain-containing protein n=1 Tax=Agromyces agglutinans TaxID=2662258 RepID=UPI001C12C14A|nr:DUF1524 domain-containing protein [Agromyces agglutinans]